MQDRNPNLHKLTRFYIDKLTSKLCNIDRRSFDIEDLQQQVYYRLIKLFGPESITGDLYVSKDLIYWFIIDYIKECDFRRRHHIRKKYPKAIIYQFDDENEYQFDDSINILDKIYLIDLTNRLKEKYRKIVILHYFEGLTYKQIARLIGIGEAGISYLNVEAIKRLKAIAERKRTFDLQRLSI